MRNDDGTEGPYELVVIEAGYPEELGARGTFKEMKRLKSDLMADYTDTEVGSQVGDTPPNFLIRPRTDLI